MLHHNDKMTMIKALDTAIATSKTWSDVAHKTFAEMAEKARDDVTQRGDFSFIRTFRVQFGIGEPTQPLNNRTLETQFNIMMQPICEHFSKFAREYEQATKRKAYLDLLTTDKDAFVAAMQKEQQIHNQTMTANMWGTGNPDYGLMQEVWRDFHVKEREREQQRQQEDARARLAHAQALKQQRAIEEEAKRRIEKERFEAEVEAKVRELKESR